MVKIPSIYGDDWGIVYYCFNHINPYNLPVFVAYVTIWMGAGLEIGDFPACTISGLGS